MAKGKSANTPPLTPEQQQAHQLERISKLLALLAVKGDGQPTKISTLAAAGFPTAEIAQLLGLTPNAVSVAVYKSKKSPRPRGRAKRNR